MLNDDIVAVDIALELKEITSVEAEVVEFVEFVFESGIDDFDLRPCLRLLLSVVD